MAQAPQQVSGIDIQSGHMTPLLVVMSEIPLCLPLFQPRHRI